MGNPSGWEIFAIAMIAVLFYGFVPCLVLAVMLRLGGFEGASHIRIASFLLAIATLFIIGSLSRAEILETTLAAFALFILLALMYLVCMLVVAVVAEIFAPSQREK